MRRLTLLITLLALCSLSAESLWKGDDIYSARKMKAGDHLRIFFKSKKLMEYNSFQNNYESASLNNSGASGSGVIDFLPRVSSSFDNKTSKKAEMKNRNSIEFSITAVVASVLSNGMLMVSGNHSITINNQNETISVQGEVDPRDIRGGQVSSDDIFNCSLVYNRTIFKKELLNLSDLSNSMSATNLQSAGLVDTKKKELLLRYFNQVLPLLFQ